VDAFWPVSVYIKEGHFEKNGQMRFCQQHHGKKEAHG